METRTDCIFCGNESGETELCSSLCKMLKWLEENECNLDDPRVLRQVNDCIIRTRGKLNGLKFIPYSIELLK